MKPFTIDVDPADTDTDGLADNNDSSGASLTLDGALTSGGTFTSADGLGRRIQITDTATVDQSGATFTITGTDANDATQTEAVTGPGSGATVTSTKYFKTISSIAITNGAGSGTVDAGTADEACSKAYPMEHEATYPASAQTDVTGTVNYSLQATTENIFGSTAHNQLTHQAISAFGSKTAAVAAASLPGRITSLRLVINSFTNGAEVQAHIAQGSPRV